MKLIDAAKILGCDPSSPSLTVKKAFKALILKVRRASKRASGRCMQRPT